MFGSNRDTSWGTFNRISTVVTLTIQSNQPQFFLILQNTLRRVVQFGLFSRCWTRPRLPLQVTKSRSMQRSRPAPRFPRPTPDFSGLHKLTVSALRHNSCASCPPNYFILLLFTIMHPSIHCINFRLRILMIVGWMCWTLIIWSRIAQTRMKQNRMIQTRWT